jgi:hypothetical protein
MCVDFSNTLTKADIEGMAEMDEMEVVREVQVSLSYTLLSQPQGSAKRRRNTLQIT